MILRMKKERKLSEQPISIIGQIFMFKTMCQNTTFNFSDITCPELIRLSKRFLLAVAIQGLAGH